MIEVHLGVGLDFSDTVEMFSGVARLSRGPPTGYSEMYQKPGDVLTLIDLTFEVVRLHHVVSMCMYNAVQMPRLHVFLGY